MDSYNLYVMSSPNLDTCRNLSQNDQRPEKTLIRTDNFVHRYTGSKTNIHVPKTDVVEDFQFFCLIGDTIKTFLAVANPTRLQVASIKHKLEDKGLNHKAFESLLVEFFQLLIRDHSNFWGTSKELEKGFVHNSQMHPRQLAKNRALQVNDLMNQSFEQRFMVNFCAPGTLTLANHTISKI